MEKFIFIVKMIILCDWWQNMLVQQLSVPFICRIIMKRDRLLVIQQSIINAPSFFFRPLLSGPTIAYSCCVSGRGRYCQFWFCWCYYDIDTVGEGFGADVYLRLFPISNTNKAKCQLCKILGGPIIPRSWYGLVWKGLYLWRWSL